MKLKVCGMREDKNCAAIVSLEPDYLGFIFYAPSPRYVENKTPTIPKTIKKTGVFVNASIDYVKNCIKDHQLDAVQLHGDETVAYCNYITNLGVEIIKAFGVGKHFNFETLQDYLTCCDYFLFDTQTESKGGSGKKFDWSVLQNYPYKKPFFLSGGIGPEDTQALTTLKKTDLPLYALDVNSKFETAPALKNSSAIGVFKLKINDL